MPSRNIIRIDDALSYYHVYARGSNKETVFFEAADFIYFERLLARYLSPTKVTDKMGITYPNYRKDIELLAYCLMNNHFHLLVYQENSGALSRFMQSLLTSYSRYFNLKYKRTGSVFESRYKSAKIDSQSYLEHISRYIHLNPRYWLRYPYSSLVKYGSGDFPWLQPKKITDLFISTKSYLTFLEDYEEHKAMLEEIKHELADH